MTIRKITAMTIATGFAMSLISSSSANADAASGMSFLIEPTGDFVGLEFRGVRDSGGFEVSEVESDSFFESFTGDAFDGWGEIYVSDDNWSSDDELVVDDLASCTVTSDGVEVEGSDYQTRDHGTLSRSVSVDCPATAVTLGSGDVDFRVVQVFEGSYFSTRIYASISSGTPNNFRLSVGGDLGSDGYEAVEASGVSNDWNYVVTGGDDGDPTIGYRSKTSFNFDEDPGDPYEDGDEETWLSTNSEITPTSTSELVYEVDTWFVDYSIDQDDTYVFASQFAGVDFGCAIPTMTATNTPAVCQNSPYQVAPKPPAAAAQEMYFFIEPIGDFVGLGYEEVLEYGTGGGFGPGDVESGNTGDAFDGWGDIYVSDDDWVSDTELEIDNVASCTVIADGSEVSGADYTDDDNGILHSSISVDCPATNITLGGGDVNFRVLQVFQGSFFSTRIYSSVSSGTPNNFRLSVGGDLGSDGDEAVEASGVSNDWNYVVTGGDDGDPTIGYRSKTSFNFDEDPGDIYEDGDGETYLSTISEITPTSTSELVYEVDTWFVDYSIDQDDTYSFAAQFAGVEFGCAIPTMTAIDTPAVCQSYAPAQAAPYSGPAQAAPYSGPLITDVGDNNKAGRFPISPSQQITVSGERLANVTGASIDGKPCEIISTANDSFQMITPEGLTAGSYDLVVESSIGNLRFLDAFVVREQASNEETALGSCEGVEASWWTKRISDTQAKAYIKCPEVGQKYRILQQTGGNGSYDSIFAKTLADENDPAQVFNEVGRYIVRTIELENINRLRITAGDQELWKVRYNR